MVLPGMGVVSELISNFSRKKIFGYEFIAFHRSRSPSFGFLVWATICSSAASRSTRALCFSSLQWSLPFRRLLSVQLDGDPLQGSISLIRYALRDRVYRPVPHRRTHWPVPRVGRPDGASTDTTSLLPTSTTSWWRAADRLSRRHPLLVAKDDGRMYSEFWAGSRRCFVHRVQPHFLSAVHSRLSGNAPALCFLSGRASGAQYLFNRRASVLAIGFIMPVIYLIHSLFYGERASANPWMLPGLEWRVRRRRRPRISRKMPVVTWEHTNSVKKAPGLDEAKAG